MKNGDKPITIIQTEEGIWKEHEAQYVLDSGGLLGLTKREYFAGLALQGMVGSRHFSKFHANEMAEYSVDAADALLTELEKPQP